MGYPPMVDYPQFQSSHAPVPPQVPSVPQGAQQSGLFQQPSMMQGSQPVQERPPNASKPTRGHTFRGQHPGRKRGSKAGRGGLSSSFQQSF